MSAFGVKTYDASGNLMFDSTTAAGGIAIDYREYGPSDSATLIYPDYAGHAAFLMHIFPSRQTVTLDTSLGYPRVTVSGGAGGARRFLVMVT